VNGRVQVSLTGTNAVTISGTSTVTGAKTPSDAYANPTDALDSLSLNATFNGATWDRARSGVTTHTATPTGWANVLASGVYHAAPVTLVDGDSYPVLLDGNGRVQVALPSATTLNGDKLALAPVTPTLYTNFGSGGTVAANIKNSSAQLYSFTCRNANTSLRYMQLFNKSTTPLNGDTPFLVIDVPGSSQTVIGTDLCTQLGLTLGTGLGWAVSTTRNTLTTATAADHDVHVVYS
jgi:hypothetical protein